MFALLAALAFATETPRPKAGFDFSGVRNLPIQSGGRIKPLSTFASEVVLFVSAKRDFPGFDSTELLFSWVTEPQAWMNERFIKISHPGVKQQLLLPSDQVRFSPHELMQNVTVAQYFHEFQAQNTVKPKGAKPNVRERELDRVLKSLLMFESVISGTAFSILPQADASAPWGTLAKQDQERDLALPIYQGYRSLIQAYSQGDAAAFRTTGEKLHSLYSPEVQKGLSLESFYNHLRPESWAWKFYLLSVLAWGAVLFSTRLKRLLSVGSVFFSLGVLAHLASMILRVSVSGRPPVTNMYESILWVSLGTLAFALYLYAQSKNLTVLFSAVALAALCVVAAEAAPTLMDPTIQPLVPVLRSNAWLTIHVLIITLSYSAFAVSLALANVNLWNFWTRKPANVIESLHQLIYRAMQIGVVLLAAGTILGGVWADYSWGRFWGWDPKETWALIALLAYLAILHARYVGWVRRFGFTAMTIVAFLTVLMAWYGVNFVLGAGLHSYGFSAGGQGWVAAFCLLEIGTVLAVYWRYRGFK